MNHSDWVQEELKKMSQSLGIHYTPRDEIRKRIFRIREGMDQKGIHALLVVQKIDLFYLSGTTQDSLLFIPADGDPLLLVRRELERARIESSLEAIEPLDSIRSLPTWIHDHWGKLPQSLGLELDVLPVQEYFRIQRLFPDTALMDAAPIFRESRKIKSPFEIGLMRKAGEIGQKVFLEGTTILKQGMSEIEFGGLLEAAAKRLGHEGILRVRSLNYEAYTWHVLSGPTGGIVSQSNSPMGGLGLSPAFPVGASRRAMKAYEPILVDFGTCYHGYQADQTRMFSIGEMGKKFRDAFQTCREIHDSVIKQIRPGADCESLFQMTLNLAAKRGYQDSYLGPPGLQTRFVGHGIGLELSEPPFLAQGHSYPLEEGMTLAIEPKIVFPGEGAVGIENTVAVTANGCEILTPLEQEIFQV